MSGRHLVISGGPLHDFAATSGALVALAGEVGLTSEVPPDPADALDLLVRDRAWDLVTVNALLWQMPADRHAPLREEWAFSLAEAQAHALRSYVEEGGALLACHTATISFDGHPSWRALLGAAWDWERSHHPPPSVVSVRRTEAGRAHPVTAGVADFDVTDEIYSDLDLDASVVPLLTSEVDATAQPVLWARTVGAGRVVVDLLGHGPGSHADEGHRAVLRGALAWLLAGYGHPARPRTREVPR